MTKLIKLHTLNMCRFFIYQLHLNKAGGEGGKGIAIAPFQWIEKSLVDFTHVFSHRKSEDHKEVNIALLSFTPYHFVFFCKT